MANMKQADLTTEISQPLLSPQSTESSSVHRKQQMKRDFKIDIEKMMIQDNNVNDSLLSSKPCIYRVPPMIRKLKEDAYTPMAVSIGPFHYGDERLQDMERHKLLFCKRFANKAKASLDDMISYVEKSEPKVRASYSENIKLPKKKLERLIFVDAAFIIELFMSYHDGEIFNDAKLSQQYLCITILNDLLLLENQLPFFLIEGLFNVAFPHNDGGHLPSFLELTFSVFKWLNRQNLEPSDSSHRIMHFTDLLRLFYLPKEIPETGDLKPGALLLYNVNELHEAGLKFKKTTSKCLLDLKFSGHNVLEIPEIFVEDGTELLFRNMIALEHCHYPHESYIIAYCFVMDCLINTNKDVNILIHEEIIQHGLGDHEDVAKLFNSLGIHIHTATCSREYLDIFKKLNDFYQNPWHKMKATLRRDYCDTPWKSVATVVGIIVIILTLIQSVFSILQVVLA